MSAPTEKGFQPVPYQNPGAFFWWVALPRVHSWQVLVTGTYEDPGAFLWWAAEAPNSSHGVVTWSPLMCSPGATERSSGKRWLRFLALLRGCLSRCWPPLSTRAR